MRLFFVETHETTFVGYVGDMREGHRCAEKLMLRYLSMGVMMLGLEGRGYAMRFIRDVLLQRLARTLEGGGEMCVLQGCAPSGVKNWNTSTRVSYHIGWWVRQELQGYDYPNRRHLRLRILLEVAS